MGWYDAATMVLGLPFALVLGVIFAASVVFIFLPLVLGLTFLIERVLNLLWFIKHYQPPAPTDDDRPAAAGE